jgi:glucose-6-phosphate 1-dehydrogenase
MTAARSDALVFFGATSDLAYKQILPALQALVRHGHFDMPVVGVAKSNWSLDQLKARAKKSLEKHGDFDPTAYANPCSLPAYIDGDYNDSAAFAKLRRVLTAAKRPLYHLAIPPSMFATVAEGLAK